MKRLIEILIIVGITIAGIILGFSNGINLSYNQKDTLIILLIIFMISVAYCFIVGEITRNNSQMDKLWSILPVVYVWVIAIRGGLSLRLLVIAILVTLWGIRLTYNFARKGAYSIKFWSGEEDYRWLVLRKKKIFQSKFTWALFDLFFISFYQNALILAMCLPALACMDSEVAFGLFDYIATGLVLLFLIIETIADEQQWKFHQKKKELLSYGTSLNELPAPYNIGFNTTGLWNRLRHPNYLGEQGIWVSIYLFVIGAGVTHYGIFNWTIFGSMLILLLFLGSSTFGESVSKSKYPEYENYQRKVFKYLPINKYE